MLFVHRIDYAPFLSESVHLSHYAQSLFVRHHRRFLKAFLNASAALIYLILITVHHVCRPFIPCNKLIVPVYLDKFRAVYVVYPDISFSTVDDALSVVQA